MPERTIEPPPTSVLDLPAFRAAPLTREPFDFLVLPDFIRPAARAALSRDYPRVRRGGSYPVEVVRSGPAFAELLRQLNGPEMRQAFEEKFGLDLQGRPTMVTVRGHCAPHDGGIHVDSKTKLITVLIYLNPGWRDPGGRLRLLRSPTDLSQFIVEIPPEDGTLVAFRPSHNSYHGHTPFAGPRRVVQFNWVTEGKVVRREVRRHRLSSWVKAILPASPA
jgi:SM-20-related protein